MNAITATLPKTAFTPPAAAVDRQTILDPLESDMPTDEVVVTTRRGLTRVALVATEVAGRFQREGVVHDAMAWMLAPRALFGGAAAVEACVARDACLRSVLLHGLSLGMDAEPDDIDALVAEDVEAGGDAGTGATKPATARGIDGPCHDNVLPFRPTREAEPRLFTATVVSHDGFETVQAFHASLAAEEAEIAGRLYCRIGAASADARIVEGFDPSDPLVAALVSEAICDTLSIIASQPGSSIAVGLDLNIEQRFQT